MNKVASICLLLVVICFIMSGTKAGGGPQVIDVTQFGAKADDQTDMSKALIKAWIKGCKSGKASKIVIPGGKYVTGTVGMEGPCKSHIEVQIDGYLKTPPTGLRGLSWITFSGVKDLSVYGNGTLDGRGRQAYVHHRNDNPHMPLATNLRFETITNGILEGLTSKDSRNFHIDVSRSKNVTLRGLTLSAPAESGTTVGIFLRRSHQVSISDATIQTGDYCIQMSDGSQQIKVEKLKCGPGGRGLLVGTLGKTPDEEKVIDVSVSNSSFVATSNSLRIEAVPGTINLASNIHFYNITLDNVLDNPITIHQHFCHQDNHYSCQNMEAKVSIKDVSFSNIKGTCNASFALDISCYNPSLCKNVELSNLDLQPTTTGKGKPPFKCRCTNVNIIKKGLVTPDGCQ